MILSSQPPECPKRQAVCHLFYDKCSSFPIFTLFVILIILKSYSLVVTWFHSLIQNSIPYHKCSCVWELVQMLQASCCFPQVINHLWNPYPHPDLTSSLALANWPQVSESPLLSLESLFLGNQADEIMGGQACQDVARQLTVFFTLLLCSQLLLLHETQLSFPVHSSGSQFCFHSEEWRSYYRATGSSPTVWPCVLCQELERTTLQPPFCLELIILLPLLRIHENKRQGNGSRLGRI